MELLTKRLVSTIFALGAITLSACLDSTEAAVSDAGNGKSFEAEASTPNGDSGVRYDEPDECAYQAYHMVIVNGEAFWVEVPSACNPYPDIYKGYPVPDKLVPWDENSAASKEEILETVRVITNH